MATRVAKQRTRRHRGTHAPLSLRVRRKRLRGCSHTSHLSRLRESVRPRLSRRSSQVPSTHSTSHAMGKKKDVVFFRGSDTGTGHGAHYVPYMDNESRIFASTSESHDIPDVIDWKTVPCIRPHRVQRRHMYPCIDRTCSSILSSWMVILRPIAF